MTFKLKLKLKKSSSSNSNEVPNHIQCMLSPGFKLGSSDHEVFTYQVSDSFFSNKISKARIGCCFQCKCLCHIPRKLVGNPPAVVDKIFQEIWP